MTLQEFKAWFEGFTEAIDKGPTQKQWARIKERVGEIDGQTVTERIYVDRYWPVVRPYYQGPHWYSSPTTYPYSTCASSVSGQAQTVLSNSVKMDSASYAPQFNSIAAMNALGAAEAASLN